MSNTVNRGGGLAELLPNAIEPEDLSFEIVEGDDAEVAAVWLSDDVGRRWLYIPVSPEEMVQIDPTAVDPVRDFSKQRN